MYIKMFKIIVSMLLFLKSCVVLLVVIAVINSVDGVPLSLHLMNHLCEVRSHEKPTRL